MIIINSTPLLVEYLGSLQNMQKELFKRFSLLNVTSATFTEESKQIIAENKVVEEVIRLLIEGK